MGNKKKREKHSGLSLSRIGACLVPGAIFAAVPSTARSFSETWPRRKKNLSTLSTALGSVGNLAQAIVVGESPRRSMNENAGTSNETLDMNEDYESEGHYATVDDALVAERRGQIVDKDKESAENPPVEPIYAKVNKNRKSQKEEINIHASSGSDDDITSVSGMGSDDDSSTAVNHPDTKPYPRKQSSKKRKSGKDKSKKNSPRKISEQIENETVTKTDLNDNILTSEFMDDFIEDRFSTDFETNLQNEFRLRDEQTTEENFESPPQVGGEEFNGTSSFDSPARVEDEQLVESGNFDHATRVEDKRFNKTGSFDSRASVEDDQLRETSIHNFSDVYPGVLHSGRKETPLGASASDLAAYSSDVSPIGEREAPIGKGLSTESINSYKERWHTLARSGKTLEFDEKHGTSEDLREEKKLKHQRRQKLGKQSRKSKQKTGNHLEEPKPSEKQHNSAKQKKGHRERFSQSAQLVQQQLVVANKLRALSTKGSYASETPYLESESRSREDVSHCETIPDSNENRQESHTDSVEVDRDNNKSKTTSLQQMSTTMAKEACRKLYLQVKTLDREKSALEALSQSLSEENTSLKKLNESFVKNIETPGSGTSSNLLQMQIEELKRENVFLKDSVHRLSVELGRYQAKYRPLSPQEVDQMFVNEGNLPEWLVNKKFVAPLMLAYDDRIKENQAIIQTYEEQLKNFKERLHKIMDENVKLEEKFRNSESKMHDELEWQQLEKQCKLVLSENEVLMERQELQNQKLEELTAFYKGEVTRLSQQCERAEVEKSGYESKIEVMNTTLNEYKQELEESLTQWKKHISVEEHLVTVNDSRRKLSELREKTQEEIDSLASQLQSVRNENNNLSVQLADCKLVNAQLEREIHSFTEVQRKNERKTVLLKEQCSHLQQREAAAQNTLSEVLKVAEKTTIERDALNEMLASKQLENKKIHSLAKLEEDKLKECKNKAFLKITAFKGRVKEQERAAELLKEHYENEIQDLRTLVRRQQKQLEDMVNDKRNLENELSCINEKAGNISIDDAT
ncbi:centrosomal protein of 89 kDa-like [Dendronephthya gigantea]|uniref:centrosomal protein of 89 kDa-like n=1 Tax=Dendronephthya gigantea TaxID=151771 RepID=UPI00106A816A|nr:centrosomal protein of 89 kDa-like [Dendronephthya gigantea]